MDIKVGGTYHTVDGRRVEVVSHNTEVLYSVHGTVYKIDGSFDCYANWLLNGRYSEDNETALDIAL